MNSDFDIADLDVKDVEIEYQNEGEDVGCEGGACKI
jgi:hypothetical protein